MNECHNIKSPSYTKEFESYGDFKVSLAKFEDDKSSLYVKRDSQRTPLYHSSSFICGWSPDSSASDLLSKSCASPSVGKKIRKFRTSLPHPKGSSKCLSTIFVKTLWYGPCTAKIQPRHSSHQNGVSCGKTLTREIKKEIRKKLNSGLTVDTIMGDAKKMWGDRDNRSRYQLSPTTEVTRQHVRNLKRANDVAQGFIDNDALQSEAYNPVIFFKQNGEEHDGLELDDIILCIQTEEMRNIFQQNDKLLTIDTTHSITQYNLKLTTIMVIDPTCIEQYLCCIR